MFPDYPMNAEPYIKQALSTPTVKKPHNPISKTHEDLKNLETVHMHRCSGQVITSHTGSCWKLYSKFQTKQHFCDEFSKCLSYYAGIINSALTKQVTYL